MLASDADVRQHVGLGPTRLINLPPRFSFRDDPAGALRSLRALACSARAADTRTIWVNQRDAAFIGFGADAVMSALAQEAKRRFGIEFNGILPRADDLKDIVRATGVPEALGFTRGDPDSFSVLSLAHGRASPRPGRWSSEKEIVVTNSVVYLNDCLARYNHTLSASGQDLFATMLGEIIGNAEDHSGLGDWWMRGSLRELPNKGYGECNIVIFNFGRTIFESLQELPAGAPLRKEIESLVGKHTRKGLFRKGYWTAESLWTVYALQGGVSRYHDEVAMGHRGTGTVRMMQFFLELGQSPSAPRRPMMTIVSGGTQISFDGTYPMSDVQLPGGQTRPVVAFNSTNDLSRAPDPQYVRRIKGFFPGTIVSLNFYLDQRHLDALGGTNG